MGKEIVRVKNIFFCINEYVTLKGKHSIYCKKDVKINVKIPYL